MAALAALLGVACFGVAPPRAAPVDRPAAAIVRDYDAVRYPSMSEGSDAESIAKFDREIRAAAERQQALALELATSHRGHPRVAELMRQRWTLFTTVQKDGDAVLRETAEWLERKSDGELVAAAAAARALAAVTVAGLSFEQRRALVAESLAAAPDEPTLAFVMLELARDGTGDPAAQRALAATTRERFAGHEWVASELALVEKLGERVGQPLALEFAGAGEDRSSDAPRATGEWRGRPCLIHSRCWTPGWFGEPQQAEVAALAALRKERPAARLPLLTLLEVHDGATAADCLAEARAQGDEALWIDRADFEQSLVRRELGLDRDGVWLLLDAEGRLRAWSFRIASLAPEIAKALGAEPEKPAKKKRAI